MFWPYSCKRSTLDIPIRKLMATAVLAYLFLIGYLIGAGIAKTVHQLNGN